MEKFADRAESKSCRRLLILFILLIINSFVISAATYENLKFETDENQLFMTDTDLCFTLKIPSSNSKNVSIKLPVFDSNISCKSITKSDFWDENNKRGTFVEVILSATEAGFYEIKPAIATISRRSYSVYFDSFRIKENPYNLVPQIYVKVTNEKNQLVDELNFNNENAYQKRKISLEKNYPYNFSVYIQNISRIDTFSWNIPHNSIFASKSDWEKNAININQNTARLLSGNKELTPVLLSQDFEKKYLLADFNWTILSSTENEFPFLYFVCESFAGHKNIIEVKKGTIEIISIKNKTNLNHSKSENDNFFENAFSIENEENVDNHELSYEECLAIVQQEKTKLKIFNKLSHKNYGIILKTDLFSIPEDSAVRSLQIDSGIKVEIKEQTGTWYYVVAVDDEKKSGWCKKEAVLLIK